MPIDISRLVEVGDKIASTAKKINSVVEKADTLLRVGDSIARSISGRNKENAYTTETMDVDFDALLSTSIDNYCLIPMADYQLKKHMMLNKMNKDITLFAITGDSISGISNKITPELYKHEYSYTDSNDYVRQYQRTAKETTTRIGWHNDTIQNYVNHNQIYGQTINVYPDDDDSGTMGFTNEEKWETYEENRNPNSILKKTKDLFRCRKINTIISKFHTDADKIELYNNTESATSAYGLSHGRNLLTYDAERNGVSYNRNGYDNPYCRVWTHHHQYSEQRNRLIRPFSIEDENGNSITKTNQDLHKWQNFPNATYNIGHHFEHWYDTEKNEETKNEEVNSNGKRVDEYVTWGWKDKGADGWAMSVLNKETGIVNITPKYLGGAEKNIHTRDCMFSIENLAWQDYDPYSFEQALSWEQRGPFGGRIMWFPPYGLNFNEDSTVNWNEHSFIGRGENVFTYANTARSGTLSFMMVVDHPSILDYATWHDNRPQDTDVLRFFAGCEGDSYGNNVGLANYTRPTPLTDEYFKEEVTPKPVSVQDESNNENPNDTPSPDEEIELTFYAFFPNNYSGAFDMYGSKKEFDNVDPIAYLLFGKGAQWECNQDNIFQSRSLDINFTNFNAKNTGRGYEMIKGPFGNIKEQDDSKNYILGTGYPKGYSKSTYIVNNDKKYYYRIDGKYEKGIEYTSIQNTFGQNFIESNRIDSYSFGLNYDINVIRSTMSDQSKYLYSLAEVASAFFIQDDNQENDIYNKIKANCSWNATTTAQDIEHFENRVKKLKSFFQKDGVWKIEEISGIGYSNSHDDNSTIINQANNNNKDKNNNTEVTLNKERNNFLAVQRCRTAIGWFKEQYSNLKSKGESSSYIKEGNNEAKPHVTVQGKNVNSQEAKKWRSAKITIKLKKRQTQEQKDINQEENNQYLSPIQYQIGLYSGEIKEHDYTEITAYQYENRIITEEQYKELDEDERNKCKQQTVYKLKDNITPQPIQERGYKNFDGFKHVGKDSEKQIDLYININDENKSEYSDRKWYYDEESKQMKVWKPEYKKTMRSQYNWSSNSVNTNEYKEFNDDYNTLRYDQEYHFFKQLHSKHPDVFASLVDKLQYFDPAFHSMTPEGFMGRLNFLHQCTRQGDTRTSGDRNGYMANNLAFGRPPFCILRLGDFYYQKIVIKNINITYDPLVLDLNNEGIGVVPLIANVTISFNFIGGGDLSGPVRRLQNAMSFNYYANGRLYDNRADRVEYRDKSNNETWETMQRDINWTDSYFYHAKMSK